MVRLQRACLPYLACVSYGLNSLKGVIQGIMQGLAFRVYVVVSHKINSYNRDMMGLLRGYGLFPEIGGPQYRPQNTTILVMGPPKRNP